MKYMPWLGLGLTLVCGAIGAGANLAIYAASHHLPNLLVALFLIVETAAIVRFEYWLDSRASRLREAHHQQEKETP